MTTPTAQPAHRAAQAPGLTAFVLQGGGGLAAAQVGMLRALTQAGIRPDLVVGASAGALNAVGFAADPTAAGLERMAALWLTMRRSVVAPFSPRTLLSAFTGRGDGLVSSGPLRRVLGRGDLPFRLTQTVIPAHVVATEVATGRPVVLSDGNTMQALLASCAFPGVYAPVHVSGRLLFDGGVSADVPVLQAEQLGATTSYVLPAATSRGADRPHGAVPTTYLALEQLLDAAAARDIAAASGTVHVLPAPRTTASGPFDFHDTVRLMQQGERTTREWLDSPVAADPALVSAAALA